MLKKIAIMAFATLTTLTPITSFADKTDDLEELRVDNKRANDDKNANYYFFQLDTKRLISFSLI
mgnify:CR=1 FL=1